MRLILVSVGRLKAGPERDLARRYADRIGALGRTIGIAGFDEKELPEGAGRSAPERRTSEAAEILVKVAGAPILAFDERGASPTSLEFANLIRAGRDAGRPSLALVIGGPDGLDEEIRAGADRVVCFGRLTLPHQLVRVLATEQIYRALTILAGHPYHRDG